jgi:hypothetical protein
LYYVVLIPYNLNAPQYQEDELAETKSTKKKGPRKKRKRKSLATRLRERNAELRQVDAMLAAERSRAERIKEAWEQVRATMQNHIDGLSEQLEVARQETRANREEYERVNRYYTESDDARRDTRQALELVFAMLAPGMPPKTLLEALERVGTEMLDGRMDTVRPILIDALATGAREGIPLFAKLEKQKEENKKKAESELVKASFIASLLDDKPEGAPGDVGDLLGALLGVDDPTQGDPFGEGCGRPDCPSCGGL